MRHKHVVLTGNLTPFRCLVLSITESGLLFYDPWTAFHVSTLHPLQQDRQLSEAPVGHQVLALDLQDMSVLTI